MQQSDCFYAVLILILIGLAVLHAVAAARHARANRVSSEKARIQEALAASEANYRCIFNTANDAILIHDAETGRILDVNDRMCEMYGYSRGEALQLIISDISANEPPYSQEDALKRVRNAVEEGPQTFEWLGRKKNEDQFWVEVNLKRITIGGQARVMAIVRDITERKKTEDALKESQRTLSTLMSNLPGMAYRCHPDTSWTMELVSDGCKELTGYLPQDFINNQKLSYNDVIHPDDRRHVRRRIKSAVSEKKPFRITYRINTASGTQKWVWEQGRGIFSQDGTLTAIEGFITDITERKNTEEALSQSETRYRLLAENVSDVIWTSDLDLNFTYISPSMSQLRGFTAEETMVQPPDQILTPESLKKALYFLKNDLEADDPTNISKSFESRTIEIEIIHKDGSAVWTESEVGFIRDSTGKPISLLGVTRDISERKKQRRISKKDSLTSECSPTSHIMPL